MSNSNNYDTPMTNFNLDLLSNLPEDQLLYVILQLITDTAKLDSCQDIFIRPIKSKLEDFQAAIFRLSRVWSN
ncbi:hypothetical protein OnM2_024090 [Erysiphe neolycopersici]|uniref:Uncharacterized protein n=1 Tax=Erysiphe neolycopersici TaxID=212602 RepID=A0A420I1K5_9PEZI|nr:hypothetical protein OnM2_024090 [Erysiphe neolycopersici]